jgi:alkylhydroperoxidase family enzyme
MKELPFTVANTDIYKPALKNPANPTRPNEPIPDQLHMRLLRPLMNRFIQRHRARGQATPLDGTPSYPYARLVQLYAGSPIARVLGRTLEEMWASPHLTRRCKLLMFAVVARGLACDVCAAEVGEALRWEGLKEATLAQVLTHLDAPELDPVERLLVGFARETIWYEPAQLQRRARAVRDRLPGPPFIEAIGVASLANGLCRLAAMVTDPA